MESINNIDISNTKGYGIFSTETGNAPFNTWKDYLLDITNKKWDEIKKFKYIDSNLVDNLIIKIKELLPFCKEVRKLRHGDFGTNNIVVNDNLKFSGVIHWDCAGYGDPLYEVGNAYFWNCALLCMKKVFEYWKIIYGNIDNFDNIIRCYYYILVLEKFTKILMIMI